jgi:hypothetical protein
MSKKPNPYLSQDIVPEIARLWKQKGYGRVKQLKSDGSYLLYHWTDTNPNSQYHIHIGNTNDNRMGYASVKAGATYPHKFEGINNGDFNADEWADYLWNNTGYSEWRGGRHTRKHNKQRKTKQYKKINKQRKTKKYRRYL